MFLEEGYVKTETKADPFSLESLIAWLEKQPANKTYCYEDTGHCLHAQFFTAQGINWSCLGNVLVRIDGYVRDIPLSFQHTAQRHPHTFGAALKRARSHLRAHG